MATYKEIADTYRQIHNQTIKTCWIADVKRIMNLPVRRAYNRMGDNIINTCPIDKVPLIIEIIETI